MGKNWSGSQSRQAARDSQLAELALAAAVGTDITGSPSLIACWCSRQEAQAAAGSGGVHSGGVLRVKRGSQTLR
jgi:hypothetical protein